VAILKSKYVCDDYRDLGGFFIRIRWWKLGFMVHTYGLRIMLGWYQWVVQWPRFMRSAETQPTTNKGQNAGSTFARL